MPKANNLNLQAALETAERRIAELEAQLAAGSPVAEPLSEAQHVLGSEHFQAFIAQSWDGIVVLDETGMVVEWNQALEELSGMPRSQSLGKLFWDLQFLLSPNSQNTVPNPSLIKQVIKDGFDTGKSPFYGKEVEVVLQRPDGERVVVQQTIFPIKAGDVNYLGGLIRDISERARAQEALRRYEMLANHSRDIILFIRKKDGRILDANHAAHVAYGYTHAELLDLSIMNLRLDPLTLVTDQMTRANQSGLLFTTRHRRKDDSSFPVEVSSQGALINGVHTLVSVVRDISEREEINALLAESEEKFSKAFHTSPQLMAFTDITSHIYLDVNQSFLQTLGYQREEVVGHSSAELQVFADPSYVQREAFALLAKEGRLQNFEVDIRTKSGKFLRGLFFAEFVQLHGKAILFTVMNDITLRKQAELALSESESRYRIIFDGAVEGIVALHVHSLQFLYANPAMGRLFGYPAEAYKHLRVFDLHPADWHARILAEIGEILQGQRTNMSAIACDHTNGTRFYVDITVSLTEIDNAPVIIAFFNDVTERRRSEGLTKARIWLSNLPPETSLDDLMQQTLDQAEAITDSQIGFFHFISPDQQTILLQNWSTHTIQHMCTADGKSQHYPVDVAGVWAESIRTRRPLIINDYPNHPERKGTPVGHAVVKRLISIPVVRGGQITAVIGVGNKEVDYDQRDLDVVELLADEVWDIVLRKRVEMALRRSEELYRSLIESQENFIILLDHEGILHYTNPIAAAFVGKMSVHLVGANIRDVFSPQFAQTQLNITREVIHSGEGRVIETHMNENGTPHWFRTSFQPVRSSEGPINLVLVNAVDITLQKDIEQVLEDKVVERTHEIESVRQRLELATAAAGIGIWDWDIKAGVMVWDEHMFQIYNLPRQGSQVLMKTWEACLHPDDVEAQITFIQSVFRRERNYKTEFRIFWPDQSEHFIGSEAITIYDDGGQPERMIGIDHDITSRRQAENVLRGSEEMLRGANCELERAMRTKDEFLASMSHELRTPLTGILGLSEALQQQVYGELNPKQTRAVQNIELSGQHLLNLINDILDVSKIEAGKFDLQFETYSLVEICQSSLQLVKGIAHKKQLKVAFSISPSTITMWCDPRRMKQILVNLLSNAVKFTPEGGSLGLDVQGNEDEQTIHLCVWDKGIGMKPQDLQRIFQPFVQLDSSLSREQTGTGLGLVLVQRMVEMHQGSLHVESIPGAGSRFEVILPWKAFNAPEPQPTGAEAWPQLNIQRSMTVEDNEIDAGHINRILNRLGIENIVITQGRFTSRYAVELKPEVILLDLGLPDQSGWSVLQELKANEATHHIPVVITSVEDQRAEASRMGAVAYLVKPFTFHDLRNALAHAAAARLPEVALPAPALFQPLIMLVDDHEINSQTITDFLENNRMRALWVSNGYAFLEKAPQIHPDVILMDIQMPGIDGLEVIRRVRAHTDPQLAASRIIAITALAMPGDRERCLQAGANDYLAKPFRLDNLLDVIRKQLYA